LEENFAMTVEPGIYFVPAIIDEAKGRPELDGLVQWEKVDEYLDFGGIRIEDDIWVGSKGPEVLTEAIPK
jgi:Xaa-Pro aminopeptidase